jgi:hypothetical protein
MLRPKSPGSARFHALLTIHNRTNRNSGAGLIHATLSSWTRPLTLENDIVNLLDQHEHHPTSNCRTPSRASYPER